MMTATFSPKNKRFYTHEQRVLYTKAGQIVSVLATYDDGKSIVQFADGTDFLVRTRDLDDMTETAPETATKSSPRTVPMEQWDSVSSDPGIVFDALETMVRSYIDAALWSTTDESDESGGLPMCDRFSPEDIAEDTVRAIRRDCIRFMERSWYLLAAADRLTWNDKFVIPSRCKDVFDFAGYDFWMTRNGHGVGFWEDGDWPDPIGRKLDTIASEFGEFDLYVGDDGRIHGCQG